MIKAFNLIRIVSVLSLVIFISCKGTDRDKNLQPGFQLYLPDDLEATLWAETPLFYNPTNMDVDHRGRIWITEAVDYRNYNNDSTAFLHHPKGDRVMILEDTNGDGKADSSKMFVQDHDLIAPLGIAVLGNKVIVSCAPHLLQYTDTNGDDVADKKEILLTGFGGKDHDHSLHAVYAGPDGNWYFNTGNAGPHIVKDKAGWTLRSGSIYTGGSPYNNKNEGNMKSDDGNIWVGGLALRLKPDATGLKVLAHNFRNSFEVIPDSYGNLWQNDNDDQVVTCRTTWVMEGGNAGFFSADGTRYWQADQRPGQDIFHAHWHQDDPGVMPAGDRTGAGSPTGIVVNESDALGKEYLGMLLSADAGRNVIFGYKPSLKNSGYDLGSRTNFISSLADDNAAYVWNDTTQNKKEEKWFRPSDVSIGTDGAIYIADWYDPVVGGHQMQDKKAYGRIYRIAPRNKKLNIPVIDLNTLEGQIMAFKNPSINVRNLGFEKLKQSGEDGVDKVKDLLNDANPYIKARTIWLLAQMGAKGKAEAEKILDDPNEQFRAVAYRALREVATDILPYAEKMSRDKSAFVRREVAVSLQGYPFEKTKSLLLELIKGYDGEDRWYLETLGTVLHGHESEIYPEIKELFAKEISPSAWNKQMTGFAWRLHPAESETDLAARAKDSALSFKERQAAITALAFINKKEAANTMIDLSKNSSPAIAEEAKYWLSFRQSNEWYNLLDWRKLNLNTAYERKLAQMKVKKQIMLDQQQSEYERKAQAHRLALDSVGGQLLIGLASENKLPEAIMAFIAEKIFQNPDVTIRVQAGKYFKRPGTGQTFSIQDMAAIEGNQVKGKTVFTARCASCHKIGNEGNAIGPDLTGIGKKFGKDELLDAIINPSAAIVFGYEPWLVNTKDGESLYGFLIAENKQTLVIKDIAGKKHVIDATKITSKQKQDKSLMPDPLSAGMTKEELADVVKYLSR